MPPEQLALLQQLPFMLAGAVALVAVAVSGRLDPDALRAAPPRHSGLSAIDLVAGLCLFLLSQTLALPVLSYLGLVTTEGVDALTVDQRATAALLSQFMVHVPLLLFVAIRAAQADRGLREAGFVPRSGLRESRAAALALLAGLPMVMGLNAAVLLTAHFAGFKTPDVGHVMLDELGKSDSLAATITLIVSAVLVAPVGEEVFFRGLVQSALLDLFGRKNRWLIIACAAVPFAAVHAPAVDWQLLPGLYLLGVVLGWLYERHGSLLPCVLVHAGFNVCNLAMYLAWLAPDA